MEPARILVVDDSPTILKVVSGILARHGYEVETSREGAHALAKIEQGSVFDLVLVDFVMPKMNGLLFSKEWRIRHGDSGPPLVLMSAKGDRIKGHFANQTGAVDAISKPFDPHALLAVVEGSLSKANLAKAKTPGTGKERSQAAEGGAAPIPVSDSALGQAAGGKRSSFRPPAYRPTEMASWLSEWMVPILQGMMPDDRVDSSRLSLSVAAALEPTKLDEMVLRAEQAGASRAALAGDASVIALSEVFQMLAMQRQTGILKVSNGKTNATLYLRQGLVDLVTAQGISSEFLLGRYLVEQGITTREKIDRIRSDLKDGELLGSGLVRLNEITETQLKDALETQSSELIFELLRWHIGHFTFHKEAPSAAAVAAQLGLGISSLVLEGFRRVDEWRLMEGVVQFDQILYVDQGALSSLGLEKLTQKEQRMLSLADGKRTVGNMIQEANIGSFDGVKVLYQFLESRVLRPLAS